jgi:hypothetical protein
MFIVQEHHKQHATPSGSNISMASQIYKHMNPTGSMIKPKIDDA